MSDEVELISDGAGLAVIGDPGAVQRFLDAKGLSSTELDLPRLSTVVATGATAAQGASALAAASGRWVKLTSESAAGMHRHGLMDSGVAGVKHAMIGKPGQIKEWIQIEQGVGALASNPAMLAGAAGIMTQLAMQQSIKEITDYLVRIDEKLDDVLRAQTNQVLARMDGVGLAVKEAESVRNAVGRVSEVTWSKVQASSATILETQGYALRQLGDLVDKLEQQSKVDELVKTARQAEAEVDKWLAVVARCCQLHDAIGVLELDRVLDSSPEELDRHRIGLRAAREERLALISHSTERLRMRMNDAVETANSKVLFNPIQSPAIVAANNRVSAGVHDFHGLVGVEAADHEDSEAAAWRDAASEQLDRARDLGAGGLDVAKNIGGETRDRAKAVTGKLSGLAGRKLRRGHGDAGDDEV